VSAPRNPGANEGLREAMYGAGMTYQSLGEQVEVSTKTVERWITTGRTPYPKHQHAVAAVLGVSADELWPDRPEKPVNERLEQAVFDAGMTWEQFARTLRVTPTQVRRWIQRGTVPYPRHQSAIAEVVQVPEDQLWPDRLAYHHCAEWEFRLRNVPLEPPTVREPAPRSTRQAEPDSGSLIEPTFSYRPDKTRDPAPATAAPKRGPADHDHAGPAENTERDLDQQRSEYFVSERMRGLMSWVDSTAPVKERDIHPGGRGVQKTGQPHPEFRNNTTPPPDRRYETRYDSYSRGGGIERSR